MSTSNPSGAGRRAAAAAIHLAYSAPAPACAVDEAAAGRAAWREVLEGFDQALAIDGLREGDAAQLRRCRAHASRLAGVRPLASADAEGAA